MTLLIPFFVAMDRFVTMDRICRSDRRLFGTMPRSTSCTRTLYSSPAPGLRWQEQFPS